jgi:hypothetical protein
MKLHDVMNLIDSLSLVTVAEHDSAEIRVDYCCKYNVIDTSLYLEELQDMEVTSISAGEGGDLIILVR